MVSVATVSDEMRLEILAEALSKQKTNDGWKRVITIADVPEDCGHYALYDGIEIRCAGVTRNMRKGIEKSRWFGDMKLPILFYKPDDDGSAAVVAEMCTFQPLPARRSG
jgi:hypothetical protein